MYIGAFSEDISAFKGKKLDVAGKHFYEIVLGAEENTKCMLRIGNTTENLAENEMKVLDPQKYKTFTIFCGDDGEISVH